MAGYFHRLASHAALNRLAIVDPAPSADSAARQYTYAELLQRVTVYRKHLVAAAQRANIRLEGARIGLIVHPGVDFIAALLGIWSVTAIVVPICLTHPLQEIAYTVTNSDQAIVIYHSDFKSKIDPLLKDKVGIDVTSIHPDTKPEKAIDFSTVAWPDDARCTIIYTSGTTGPPKGAVQTIQGYEHTFAALAQTWELAPQDRALHVLPLHHGHGLTLSLLLPLWVGATVEFKSKFDEAAVWERLLSTSLPPITVFMAVPTIWVKMIAYFNRHFKSDPAKAKRAQDAAGILRLAISGSAALPGPIRDGWAGISNGYLLLERYGTTETGITYSERLSPGGRIQGSVGWPLPGVQTRLIAEDGRDVSNIPETMGEIQIKTAGLMKEYWRKPEATAKERTSDGWWKTGDMAVIKAEHNNATFIQGRASADIIKSGGYKISALDIETAMLQLPFVEEVAVVGVPDTTWGEVVAAICVPAEGKAADLTVANLREKLRSELAPYKLPQKLHILDQMPRNAMGKVQKKALREQCFPTQRAAKL